MPIEKILIEYAKSQLLLAAANERIAQLETQLKELSKPATSEAQN